MSNLSGLPPSSVARAAILAVNQDIAVRLINLPDSLQNNPEPLKLEGIVKGQAQDGSLQVETKRGIINILLKDRGSLTVGQKIEVDIPPGRPPKQAAIRPAPSTPPTMASQIQTSANASTFPLTAATANASLRLDRTQPLKSDDLAEALLSAKPSEDIRLAAPLQAGQILRLVPISLGSNAAGNLAQALPWTPEELFSALMNMISQSVDLPEEMKRNLTQILGNVDLSTLLPPSDEFGGLKNQETLQKAFQTLAQDLDLPDTIKLQNAALQNTPSSIFNPARVLDVKILAFQTGSFQTLLNNAQSGFSGGQPIPLVSENFLVAPPVLNNSATNAAAPSPSVIGQVTGFTPQGQPIVSLSLPGSTTPQNYAVQFLANNIVEGSPVIISPLPVNTAQPGLVSFPLGAGQPLASWVQPEIWDSLQTLIGSIAHINPAMAQAMTQMLPSANASQNMGPLSMFFLSVMRSGELDTWIGQPAINLLKESGKVDILRSLAGESILTSRLDTAPFPNDWRATIFPFWHDQQVHKLPLFYKQWKDEDDKDAERERKKKMRFMFELKLSRMGPVQVDGFMQREKLDMILRTKSIIGPNMQDALRKTYHRAMERSNLSGEITFQFKPEQWVHVDMPMETLA